MYELCTLNYPFQASNQAALIMKILKGEYAPVRCVVNSVATASGFRKRGETHSAVFPLCFFPPHSASYSRELDSLVVDLLQRDPGARPSIREILLSPFIYAKVRRFSLAFPLMARACFPS